MKQHLSQPSLESNNKEGSTRNEENVGDVGFPEEKDFKKTR